MALYPYLVAAFVFGIGLYGVITSRSLLHTAVCLTVMQSSTYVALLAVGYRTAGVPPIQQTPTPPGKHLVDPVVQALTLTDIVVSVVVLALILSLAMQVHRRAGTVDPDAIREIQG